MGPMILPGVKAGGLHAGRFTTTTSHKVIITLKDYLIVAATIREFLPNDNVGPGGGGSAKATAS